MGLDCSFDAFHGAYGAFNRWRQIVARATGGSFPPHDPEFGGLEPRDDAERALLVMIRNSPHAHPEYWWWGDGYGTDSHPGLRALFDHSDCDGEIDPATCELLANELEALLPEIERLQLFHGCGGHIYRDGGYVEVTKRFIVGCRTAYVCDMPLKFQ